MLAWSRFIKCKIRDMVGVRLTVVMLRLFATISKGLLIRKRYIVDRNEKI